MDKTPFYFESVAYWSEGDEQAHFDWLKRIDAIRNVFGVGRRVYLEIDHASLTLSDRKELEAVYRRYGADLKQLTMLDSVA